MKSTAKIVRFVAGTALVVSFAGCSGESSSVESVAATDVAETESSETTAANDASQTPEVVETSETAAAPDADPSTEIAETPETPVIIETSFLDRTMTLIDGSSQDLSAYRGKVVLVVNVASECGLTPQYGGLQTLYESKQEDGLVILGFPANNFGGQEPGSDSDITEFCTTNYGITFPMFSKISVKGDDQDALFAELSAQTEEPSWNFTKYLIDREGHLVERFDPRTTPEDEKLVSRIDELLNAG